MFNRPKLDYKVISNTEPLDYFVESLRQISRGFYSKNIQEFFSETHGGLPCGNKTTILIKDLFEDFLLKEKENKDLYEYFFSINFFLKRKDIVFIIDSINSKYLEFGEFVPVCDAIFDTYEQFNSEMLLFLRKRVFEHEKKIENNEHLASLSVKSSYHNISFFEKLTEEK